VSLDLRAIARELGLTDTEAHLKFEVNYNLLPWRKRYNLLQLGYFRPHNRHPRYGNLYFAGASTHSGTDVPTALGSARLAAKRILEEQGIR
jgi:phytoene dehydrogenase-like protein